MEICNTFILILSGCNMQDRRLNCRQVWLKHLLPDMRYKFVVGEGILEDSSENDVVLLNVGDDYYSCALKLNKMLQWVTSNYIFDWLVIVDDDTYLVPERLKYVCDDNYDLIGYIPTMFLKGRLLQQWWCLCGGFGMILRLEMALKLILKNDIIGPSINKDRYSDGWLLRSVLKLNGKIKPDREFISGYELIYPTKENRFISAHRLVTMDEMQAIDRLLRESDSIVSSILVTHHEWLDNQGTIICLNDNTFYLIGALNINTSIGTLKKLHIDKGTYYYDNDSCCIVLNWNQWSPEAVATLDNPRALNSLYPIRYTHNTKGFNKIVLHLNNKNNLN